MRKGLFVTATGTDVGKTVVTAGLLHALRQQGRDIVPSKPLQSGGEKASDGCLYGPDTAFLMKACTLKADDTLRHTITPYLYEPACSPHLAAKMAGDTVSIDKITATIDTLSRNHEGIIVEGAGGIMVPINEQETMRDLMVAIGFPVVLVAHGGLGTINHTLLSLEALKTAGLTVLGVIINHSDRTDGDDYLRQDNIQTIAQFGKVPILGNVRHLGRIDASDPSMWETFRKDITNFDIIEGVFDR